MNTKQLKRLFPHGKCECHGTSCCGGRGPAAFEVIRDEKKMLVCTRCDLSSDKDKRLLITGREPASTYFDFDALGAVCLGFALEKQETTTPSPRRGRRKKC